MTAHNHKTNASALGTLTPEAVPALLPAVSEAPGAVELSAHPLVTSDSWTNTAGGDWGTGSNWSTGLSPTSSTAATIAAAGNYTVTITSPEAAQSLSIADTGVTVSDTSTLSIGTTLALSAGVFDLASGGDVVGGTITVGTNADFQGDGGTLSCAKFDGTINVNGAGESVTIANSIGFADAAGQDQGAINFSSGGNYSSSYLYIDGDDTLSNVMVSLGTQDGNNSGDYIYNNDTTGNGATLTLASTVTIDQTGQQAVITGTDNANDAIINKGTINAGWYGGIFQIDATRFTNSGTITVSNNDLLNLTGSISTALIDSINNAAGGEVRISGSLNNAGNTLTVANGGYLGINATVTGGTLVSAGGGAGAYDSYNTNYGDESGVLSGVAVQGTLTIGAANYGSTSLTLENGTTITGVGGTGLAAIVFNATNYNSSYLYVDGTATLSNLVVTLGTGNGNGAYDYIYNNDTTGNGAILTLASTVTINQTGQAAAIVGTDNANDAIINKGDIVAGYYGGIFQIDATRFTNNGTIIVSNGDLLNLTGSISVALVESISNAAGGEIRINGALNNTGNTLTVASGGYLGINGTITGGTLVSNYGGAGAYNSVNSNYGDENGVLSGVAVQGTLTIGAANYGSTSLTLENGTTITGVGGTGLAAIVFNATNYNSSYLYVDGTATLSNLVLTLGTGNGNGAYDYIYNNDTTGNGAILTLASTVTINQTGQAAAIVGTDNANDAIINKGDIVAGYYGGIFQIDATRFTNNGTITVSNGDLLNLTGSISVALVESISNSAGGEIRINGALNNTGNTLTVASGGYLGINGTITGGTLVSNYGGAGAYNSVNSNYGDENGVLSGVAVQGTLTIGAANYGSTSLTLENGTTITGVGGTGLAAIVFNATNYNSSYLYVDGTATLSNLVLTLGTGNGNGAYDYIYNNDTTGNGAILTLASTVTINQTGQAAAIVGTDNANDAIINKGDIVAGYYGGIFQIDATRFTNNGTITVSNGDLLNLTGSISVALVESISNSAGGEIRINGALNNTGNTLTVASGGYLGINGTITGGTLVSNYGGAGAYNSVNSNYGDENGVLSGVAVQGTLTIGAANYGSTSLTLENGTTITGVGGTGLAAIVFNATNYNSSYLYVDGTATLSNLVVTLGTGNGNGAYDYIYNNDTSGNGAILTLASTVTINQTGQAAAIVGTDNAGDGVVNKGTINATYGGIFLINPLNFTNLGTISSANGETVTIQAGNFTDLQGTALVGGTYIVNVGSAFNISNGAAIITDNANIILNGAGSSLTSGGGTALDSSLGAIAAGGTLNLQNGRDFTPTANAGTFTDSGLLSLSAGTLTATALSITAGGKVFGNGSVQGAVNNAGSIEANSGYLQIAGALGGAGAVLLDAGASLETGGAVAGTQAVTFGGTGALLKIDAVAGFAGVLGGFAAGDVIDVAGKTLTSVSTSGTNLLAVSASGTSTLTLAAALAQEHLALAADGSGGTKITAYAYAASSMHAPEPVAFGNHHVGAALSTALTLTNTAPTGGFSERLDAKFSAVSGGASATGTIFRLGAGLSNSSSLVIGLNTANAGAISGSATLALTSDGGGIDGFGDTSIGSQIVTVTGAIYAYAAGSQSNGGTLVLANSHVGQAASGFVTLTNSAVTGGYSEALDAGLSGASSGFATGGTLTGLAAGATSSGALQIGYTAANAGLYSGSALLNLVSDGTGIDGLGTTSLGSQTVTVKGAAYAYARGTQANGGIVRLANTHVGQAASGYVTLTNSALANGFSEALDATLTTSAAGFTAGGAVLGLAAGLSNSSSLQVGYTASQGGAYSGLATLGLVSDGNGIDGLGDTALASQSATITGAAYAYAVGTLASANINLGVVHVGDMAAAQLDLMNAAAANGYSEALDAAWGTAGAGVLVNGFANGIAAGAGNTALSIGLATSASGSFANTALLDLTSDGTGIDGLGTTALAAQTITVSAIVDNYAQAAFDEGSSAPAITGSGTSFALNLGTLVQGGASESIALGAMNAASGLSDLLQGTLATAGGAGFTNAGFGAFGGLGAGQGELSQSVTLTTGTAGVFSETILLSSAGTNASGYDGALATETLTITGTVVTPSSNNTYTLATGPNTVLGAAGGDLFIAAAGAINSHDQITGGSGSNTLQLTGGGLFDLDAPKVLANIETIVAAEGQAGVGTGADGRQTVYLRDGVNQTVDVTSGTAAKGNTNPETITLYDGDGNNAYTLGAGSDVLYLSTGNDTVVLGGSKNSVIAGGGTAMVQATAALANASVVGTTSGSTVLQITNAGTVTLNAADTDLTVQLDAATRLILNKMSFITVNGGNGGDNIAAGAANQTLIGGAADLLTGYSGGGDSFVGASAALNGDTLGNWTRGDVIDLTDMSASATLSYAGNSKNGKLTVSDGVHKAIISFSGSFSAASFASPVSDGHGGALIGFG